MDSDKEVDMGDAPNRTDNSNMERKVQHVRDENFMYEPLLDYSTRQTQGIKQTRVTRWANAFDTPSERV